MTVMGVRTGVSFPYLHPSLQCEKSRHPECGIRIWYVEEEVLSVAPTLILPETRSMLIRHLDELRSFATVPLSRDVYICVAGDADTKNEKSWEENNDDDDSMS